MKAGLVHVLPSLGALLAAAIVGAGVVALAGGSPSHALAALLEGSLLGPDSLSETLVKTCPLLLCGLAVAVAFQTGVWNIGAEGQLLMGALATAWAGSQLALPGAIGLPLILVGAAAMGAAWAAAAAVLKLRREVSEVISTIMLNFIALGLIGYLVQGPLMEAGGRYPQTDPVLLQLRLPRLSPPLRIHAGLLLAAAAVAGVHIGLYRTRVGFEMRAVGLNPKAAQLAGTDVAKRVFWGLVASGALAGLAGGVEVSAVTYRLYERFSPGYGFTAIAVGLLGRLKPTGIVLAAVLFGALEAGSNAMQREAGVSAVLVSIIQGTVILFLVVVEHGHWLAIRPKRSEE